MTATKEINRARERDAGSARIALDAQALDELTSRVSAHFERHQPEPASFPAMASRVIDLAEHPEVDIAKLAHLIERDPAICASVLAVANSAANRRAAPVQVIRTAISLLGLRRVANIAVGVACRALFDVELRVEHELFPGLWERLFHAAMTEAFTVSFVTIERGHKASEGAFLSGMLHNIGKSLAARSLAGLILGGELSGIPDDSSIDLILRRTRASIGSKALAAFNMPEHLVELCRRQNDEQVPALDEWIDLHFVRIVSELNELRMSSVREDIPVNLLISSVRAVGLYFEDVLNIARQLSEHSAQVSLLFSSSDGANESGFLEYVERCLVES